MRASRRSILFLSAASLCCPSPSSLALAAGPGVPERPDLVQSALARKEDVYMFGLGSNMLRSKVESRSICGNKINVKSMEPAIVKGHRLAFNMRGFPPLEPGMGSLEPAHSPSTPLLAYEGAHEGGECHGALIRLSAEDYERVMRSEGVGRGGGDQGYEEVVVDAIPYHHGGRRPVKAVALRAREHVRLKKDPAPSQRYMNILKEGAEELGLDPRYADFLERHPVSRLPTLMRKIAVCNLVWTATLSFRMKFRLFSKIQSWFLWRVYASPVEPWPIRLVSEILTTAILLPGSILGVLLLAYLRLAGKLNPMMKTMVDSHW